MINNELRNELPEDAVVFDNPSFDNSIIGLSSDDRVVYDYDKMVAELMQDDACNYEDAADFISYNTIRSLHYLQDENKPIILMAFTL